MPTNWADKDLENIHFDKIRYYLSKGQQPARSWDDVPDDVKETFERLGIPEQERKFLAGNSEPGEADLAVFATLRSIEGLTTFDDVMANTKLSGWYERMAAAVGPATRVE